MNKEYKKAWLESLRSGKFTQGRFSLRAKNKAGHDVWDPFGILLDLLPISKGWELDEHENRYYFRLYDRDDGQAERMHEIIRDKMKITIEQEMKIIDMNDTLELDLNRIADYVEIEL